MRHKYTTCVAMAMLIANINTLGQVSLPTYNSSDVLNITQSLPAVRQVRGVSKIIVDYEGEWTASQRQAFAYACEIWEEAMPTTFPIRVQAIMDDTYADEDATDESLLFEVRPTLRPYGSESTEWTSQTYQVQPKGCAFHGMENRTTMYHFDLDMSYFNTPDMTIIYYLYQNMDDIYSFSSDETHVGTKYDFVTSALRCIAKGLGFTWSYYRARNNKLWVDGSNLSPFEYFIYQKLKMGGSSNDSINCYQNAVSNNFSFTDNSDNLYQLYTPSQWDPTMSLNYFVADEDNKLTQLLRWDFGRGMVLRDIIDSSVYDAFKDLLVWEPIWLAIGTGQPVEPPISLPSVYDTENSIPQAGHLSINVPGVSNLSSMQRAYSAEINNMMEFSPLDSVQLYMQQFHPCYYNGSINTPGWIVSLQKTDGTWDAVYFTNDADEPLQVDVSDFTLHESLSSYARSYDGHLRCRVTYVPYPAMNLKRCSYYYVLNAQPLEVDVEPQKSRTVAYSEDDEYSKVIKVEIGNLEGVTSVRVAQLNDWATVPYFFYVPNFKDGYFLATVDVEYQTVFTIYTYNSTGYSTRTVTYTPEHPESASSLSFERSGNYIVISSSDPSFQEREGSITSVLPGLDASLPVNIVDNKVDVSLLHKGVYMLNVADRRGRMQSYKFVK